MTEATSAAQKPAFEQPPVSGLAAGVFGGGPTFDSKNKKRAVLLSVLLFGVVCWVFWPALDGEFLFYDEAAYVTRNAHVNSGLSWENSVWAFSSLTYANWHPITWLSHMLDCEMYGLKPWGHHLSNVLLHAVNTVLVFLVLRRMTGSTWRSLVVAALFGLHPLRVQSVAWISERKDVLSLLFWMLTLWAYARYAGESRARGSKTKIFYVLMILFFAIGLMSKTMLVTLPFVMLLLDYWPLERWRELKPSQLLQEKAPLLLLAIAVSAVSYEAQVLGGMTQEMAYLPLGDRIGNALISYFRYIGKTFWPSPLCIYYLHPGHWPTYQVAFAALFVVGVSLVAVVSRRRMPYLPVGWFWYLGTLVPVIGLVQLLSQAIADRYSYIPTIGVAWFAVWGLKDLTQRWRYQSVMLATAASIAVAACVVRTRAEIRYWKDDATICRRAVEVDPNNYMAHYSLGTVLLPTQHGEEALREFQEAARLKPDYAPAEGFVGALLGRFNRLDEALVHLKTSLRLDPSQGKVWYNCGLVLSKQGKLNEAESCFMKAAELDPTDGDAPAVINVIARNRTIAQQANTTLREAVKQSPDRVDYLNNLAWLLATNPDENVRNGNEAVQYALRACELTHYKVTICVGTLAAAYGEAGRFDEAIKTAELACSLASEAGDEPLLQKNQKLLALFRAHRSYYEVDDYQLAHMAAPNER